MGDNNDQKNTIVFLISLLSFKQTKLKYHRISKISKHFPIQLFFLTIIWLSWFSSLFTFLSHCLTRSYIFIINITYFPILMISLILFSLLKSFSQHCSLPLKFPLMYVTHFFFLLQPSKCQAFMIKPLRHEEDISKWKSFPCS